jgi:hypothetical protein
VRPKVVALAKDGNFVAAKMIFDCLAPAPRARAAEIAAPLGGAARTEINHECHIAT